MCGIVGYVGDRPVQEVLLEGLGSSSTAAMTPRASRCSTRTAIDSRARGRQPRAPARRRRGARRRRTAGGVAVADAPATTGIGHTRWATHGRVTEENAHPHYDNDNRVHVVVNGIVENYMELKQELLTRRARVHLGDRRRGHRAPDRRTTWRPATSLEAVRAAYTGSRGHYAFVAMPPTSPSCSSAPARSAR